MSSFSHTSGFREIWHWLALQDKINQAFDHFYAKYIEDESTISSADPKGLKTDLAFQESLRVNHTFKHYFAKCG